MRSRDWERVRRKVCPPIFPCISKPSTIHCTEIEGFYNLLFSHFLALYPIDAPETRSYLDKLLTAISSSSDHSSTKYRMYAYYSYT